MLQQENNQLKYKESFTKVEKLFQYLQLSNYPDNFHSQAIDQFSFLVPYSFAQRMKKNDANDPLLLQVLPQANELIDYQGFAKDPLAENNSLISNAILQKYQYRLLLMPTSACGIHCRYCFRRHFPYSDKNNSSKQLSEQIKIIAQKTDIQEVILSGGDPLTLNDNKMADILLQLNEIKHIKRIRIHTRQLIVEPRCLTTKLVNLFHSLNKQLIMVFHCNHANELSKEVALKLAKLDRNKMTLLNQSVLLKGINNDAKILAELSEKLFENGIIPYYLHQLDRVAGSQHFLVDDKNALLILQQMQEKLPGFLVPKLVRENAGSAYKEFVSG